MPTTLTPIPPKWPQVGTKVKMSCDGAVDHNIYEVISVDFDAEGCPGWSARVMGEVFLPDFSTYTDIRRVPLKG